MTYERVRLFVALELPEEVREELVRWRGPLLRGAEGVRPISRADLHVTLCFLGWRTSIEIEPIAAACEVVRPVAPLELALGDAALLPRRRPRVLAVSLVEAGGALTALHAALSASLEPGGFYERERRPFYGHVTVARAGRGARLPRAGMTEDGPNPARFTAATVTLYRSRLGRGGASYEPLTRVALGSA